MPKSSAYVRAISEVCISRRRHSGMAGEAFHDRQCRPRMSVQEVPHLQCAYPGWPTAWGAWVARPS